MDNNVKSALYAANGFKIDDRFFYILGIANGGFWDTETQDLFNNFAQFNMMKQNIETNQPLKEQPSVSASLPATTETSKCSSCGSVIDRDSKFCKGCGCKLEVESFMYNQPTKILFKKAFYKDLTNLLYSSSGGKKTLLSIYLGASAVFKKCAYVITDSSNDFDLSRYSKALGDKAIIITQRNFQQKTDVLEDSKRWQIFLESMAVFSLTKDQYYDHNRMETILSRIKRKYHSRDQEKKVDEITVLCELISEVLQMGIDFLCIDSLNGTFGDSRKISRKTIRRITQLAKNNGVTLLCIHHTNKAGLPAGSSGITEEFDYAGYLSDDITTTDLNENESILLLSEEKARYSKRQIYRIKTIFDDGLNPKFELIDQEENLKDNFQQHGKIDPPILSLTSRSNEKKSFVQHLILDLLEKSPKGILTLKELLERVTEYYGEVKDTKNVYKALKRLEIEGLIERVDGKSWRGGIKKTKSDQQSNENEIHDDVGYYSI
jgi:hypothetical protein